MRICKDTQKLIEIMQFENKASGGVQNFILWDCQKEYLGLLHNKKKIVSLKKRQVGWSQLTGADSLSQCMVIPNFLVLALSKTGDDAVEFLRRIKQMYNSLPEHIKAACKLIKDSEDIMEFDNGSRIKSLPAKRGAGMTADRVIIDESAYITTSESKITLEEVLMRIEPTLDKAGGQLILISTANGYNTFHKIYQKAKEGLSSWVHYFVGCYADPTFTKAKREQIILDFGEDHANQEYPENDTMAFLMSGRLRFNKTALAEQYKNNLLYGECGFLSRVHEKRVIFKPNNEGWLRIIKHPVHGRQYVIGADVCEGIEIEGIAEAKQKTDLNGVHVLDAVTMEQVAQMHNRLEPDVLAEEIKRLAQYYNNAFVGVERNNDGKTLLSNLKKIYTNLYSQEKFDEDRQTRQFKLGWLTTAQSKRVLVSYGAKVLREGTAIVHTPELFSELMTFVQNADGSCEAQDSCHDDLVMGWLIALQMCLVTELHGIGESKEDFDDGFEDYRANQNTGKELAGYFR